MEPLSGTDTSDDNTETSSQPLAEQTVTNLRRYFDLTINKPPTQKEFEDTMRTSVFIP